MLDNEKLTKENAKEFYFKNNGVIVYLPRKLFFVENFDNATLLEWNVEIVNKLIKEYKEDDKKAKKHLNL